MPKLTYSPKYSNPDINMYVSWLMLSAVIDVEAGNVLLGRIQSELDLKKTQFLLDFSEVQSADTEGFAFLIEGIELISEAGGHFSLYAMNDSIRSLFVSKGLQNLLDFHD